MDAQSPESLIPKLLAKERLNTLMFKRILSEAPNQLRSPELRSILVPDKEIIARDTCSVSEPVDGIRHRTIPFSRSTAPHNHPLPLPWQLINTSLRARVAAT